MTFIILSVIKEFIRERLLQSMSGEVPRIAKIIVKSSNIRGDLNVGSGLPLHRMVKP